MAFSQDKKDQTFSKMGCDDIDLDLVSNETHSSLFISIHTAESWAKITVAEVSVGQRALLGFISRAEGLISGSIVI